MLHAEEPKPSGSPEEKNKTSDTQQQTEKKSRRITGFNIVYDDCSWAEISSEKTEKGLHSCRNHIETDYLFPVLGVLAVALISFSVGRQLGLPSADSRSFSLDCVAALLASAGATWKAGYNYHYTGNLLIKNIAEDSYQDIYLVKGKIDWTKITKGTNTLVLTDTVIGPSPDSSGTQVDKLNPEHFGQTASFSNNCQLNAECADKLFKKPQGVTTDPVQLPRHPF